MTDFDKKVKKEINNIKRLLVKLSVDQERINLIKPIIENTAWMKVKLDDERLTISKSSIVISYNNGGGQKGIRENPLYKGYESLWKSYMQGMQRIIDCVPEEFVEIKKEELEKPKTMLEIVRARKQA